MLTQLKDENAVAIDYETFYNSKTGYSLSAMTPYAYVHDKRFDPYLVSICGWEIFDDGILAAELETGPEGEPKAATRFHADGSMWRRLADGRQLYVGRPEAFGFWSNLNGRILLAHNAGFDEVVTDRCIELKIIPELTGCQWQDTADLTAYLMVSRSLKDAMKYLFDKEISKAVRSGMDGRHDWELDEKERRALVEYGGDDAVECHDIWLNFADKWPEIERKISCQNRDAIRRGFRIDRAYAEKALKALKSVQAEALEGIPWVTRINPKTGTFYAAGSLPALRQAVEELGITPPKSFKKDDPGFLDWLKEHDDIDFIKARTKYAGTVQHVARIETLVKSADENDLVRPGLIYFGAATGRLAAGLSDDSGGKNINMLNLPRSNLFKGDPRIMDGEGIDLRGMYIPRPGYKLVVMDYSQVEARFALWLANDTHMMEALKRVGNLYAAFAEVAGWCKSGVGLKHADPEMYRLAKCCLTADSLVLTCPKNQLTKPRYKRIIDVKITDLVWDGHEWVQHLGVIKRKEVPNDELIEIGGVCLTKDHRIYVNDTTSRRADEILEDEATAAMAWGQSQNPVQGWAHVRILAAALARLGARALYLGAREAVHILARTLRLHRVRRRDSPVVGQCPERADDQMHEMRAPGVTEQSRDEYVGEETR